MNIETKICEQTLVLLLLEKLTTILLFSLGYGALLYLVSLFLDGNELLLSAMIILGLIGIIYNGLKLYIVNNLKKFTDEVPMKILNSCIGKSRSIDYGDDVYFPVVEYEYLWQDVKIKSSNVYWDFDSFFYSRGILVGLTEKESVNYAENILDNLKNKNTAYRMTFYPNKTYLDIVLNVNRKKYFRNQISLSVILIIISVMYLL